MFNLLLLLFNNANDDNNNKSRKNFSFYSKNNVEKQIIKIVKSTIFNKPKLYRFNINHQINKIRTNLF